MQKPFPPGDICNHKIRSNWREFEFMLHQVQSAINSDISLKETLNGRHKICKNLSENDRQRKSQLYHFNFS